MPWDTESVTYRGEDWECPLCDYKITTGTVLTNSEFQHSWPGGVYHMKSAHPLQDCPHPKARVIRDFILGCGSCGGLIDTRKPLTWRSYSIDLRAMGIFP